MQLHKQSIHNLAQSQKTILRYADSVAAHPSRLHQLDNIPDELLIRFGSEQNTDEPQNDAATTAQKKKPGAINYVAMALGGLAALGAIGLGIASSIGALVLSVPAAIGIGVGGLLVFLAGLLMRGKKADAPAEETPHVEETPKAEEPSGEKTEPEGLKGGPVVEQAEEELPPKANQIPKNEAKEKTAPKDTNSNPTFTFHALSQSQLSKKVEHWVGPAVAGALKNTEAEQAVYGQIAEFLRHIDKEKTVLHNNLKEFLGKKNIEPLKARVEALLTHNESIKLAKPENTPLKSVVDFFVNCEDYNIKSKTKAAEEIVIETENSDNTMSRRTLLLKLAGIGVASTAGGYLGKFLFPKLYQPKLGSLPAEVPPPKPPEPPRNSFQIPAFKQLLEDLKKNSKIADSFKENQMNKTNTARTDRWKWMKNNWGVSSQYGHLPYAEMPRAQREIISKTYYSQNKLDQKATMSLYKDAYVAFKKMHEKATEDGVDLRITSAYRSHQTQHDTFFSARKQKRYNNSEQLQKEHGSYKMWRSLVSAPEGCSEHSFMSVDFADGDEPATDLFESFADTKAGLWLAKHAHEHGFYLSFPESNVQGVLYEPWHYCYLGTQENPLEQKYINAYRAKILVDHANDEFRI